MFGGVMDVLGELGGLWRGPRVLLWRLGGDFGLGGLGGFIRGQILGLNFCLVTTAVLIPPHPATGLLFRLFNPSFLFEINVS